jgi:hypothetical protein
MQAASGPTHRHNESGTTMCRVSSAVLVVLLLLQATLATARAADSSKPSPQPSPVARTGETLSDAWWTGPLLAPSAGTLPRGHILVEPYLYDVMQYGIYDRSGALTPAAHSNDVGSLTYMIYGLTDRISVGLIPTFGYNTQSGGLPSSRVGLGDLGVLAQFRLTQFQVGRWTPTTSIAVQETFPIGTYQNLGNRPGNGVGSGVYSTKVSLYTQTYAWMPNGRIMRLRLNFSEVYSGSADVSGVSVYGTGRSFRGTVQPGNSTTVDGALEYSITRNWVFASDLVYGYSGETRVAGRTGTTSLADSHSFAVAPAFEYNWTANAGIIAGVRYFPSGRNTAASLTPVIAINLVR